MEARPADVGIVDWALRQTSMEEVFLSIAVAAEVERTLGNAGSQPPTGTRIAPTPETAKVAAGAKSGSAWAEV